MYDNEMKYCPVCEDEYMPSIVNCGVCGAVLLSGLEMLELHTREHGDMAKRKGALSADDDIATVFKGPMVDVKRVEAKLLSVNIGTLIVAQDSSCGKGCCAPEVELKIRREDGHPALRIIESDFENMTGSSEFISVFEDTGFDPIDNESTCPACGCTFSTQNTACPDCGLCFA